MNLNEAWEYIKDPSNPKYYIEYDFLLFLCHDYEVTKQQIKQLEENVDTDTNQSQFLVYTVSMLCFSIIGCIIYKFAVEVTKPITRLTEHTKSYQNSKTLTDKEKIIKENILNDDLFKQTRLKIKKEKLDRGDYTKVLERNNTINVSKRQQKVSK